MEFKEKICLITGFTSGIGWAAAEKFAFAGCELLLVSRSRHRGEKAAETIALKTGNDRIQFFSADLSSVREINNLSERLHTACSRIDVLVNNAGAYFSNFHETIDGIEATFAVNYISRFLLTNQVLDLILNSSSGRIINVSGEYHRKGELVIPLEKPEKYSAFKSVSSAKLADIIFVKELSRRLKGKDVTVNAMHPGTIATNIIKNDPDASGFLKMIYSLVSTFFHKPSKAADDIFYLAFSGEVKDISGGYFIHKKMAEPSKVVNDSLLAARLWEYSESLTGYKNGLLTYKPILEKK
jgi:NAD(P)-dependent dehydrogenase (short-subunit alcohol dehydrogenase family)